MNAFAKFILWAVAILGAIGAIVYLAFFDLWVVPTDDPQFVVSVEPTLSGGDSVLVSKHGTPGFGHLVRCADPDAAGRFVVGRLIGTSGDNVEIASEAITVNKQHVGSARACTEPNRRLRNPATGSDEDLNCFEEEMGGFTNEVLRLSEHPEGPKTLQVEQGKVYLVSDNRHMHLDSRDFGTIDPATCKHIVYRLWSSAGFADSKHRFQFIW